MNNQTSKQPVEQEVLVIAHEIKRQLGHQALAMMGASHFVGGPDYLMFSFKGTRRCNKLQIRLNGSDLYDITFYKLYGGHIKSVASYPNTYAEDMHRIIETVTGLYLSL